MLVTRWAVLGVLALFHALPLPAREIGGLPLHTERLSDRAIRLWVGDHESTTAVVALATERGIVVVDTTDLAGVDRELRSVIAQKLGRDDFRYLVNTHEHADHTSGNAVYSDCEIIAQSSTAEGMKRRAEDPQQRLERLRDNLPRLEAEAREAGSEAERAAAAEKLAVSRARHAAIEAGIAWTLPTLTFSDRMRLDMGDTTIELLYAGGVHSAGDIFIFVPEDGLLLTGDVMADSWSTDSPGCLQAFMIRPGVDHDFPLLLENWAYLLARKDEIKDLVPGHWNGDISLAGFEQRYNYVKTLFEGVGDAVQDGRSLEDALRELDLAERFPELVGSPGITPRNHSGSVIAMWGEITGSESAADALQGTISSDGIEAAIAECKAARQTGDSTRYFLEYEFNQLGYRYLGEHRLDEAIAVFTLNTELYPDSWNVYDSLGEAYLARGDEPRGDRERSAELYSTSLAMRERRANERQPADTVLDAVGVKPGMVVGEVGAGHGRYTVHLAARVGATGKVYANDIDEARLDILRLRCEHDRISNVEIILGEVEDPRFPESALDMIFMVWVFHMVDEPVPLLASFGSSLKPGAPVVMVEPVPEEIEEERENALAHGHGDVHVNVLTEETMRDYASQAGFRLVQTMTDLLEMDVIYILEKE